MNIPGLITAHNAQSKILARHLIIRGDDTHSVVMPADGKHILIGVSTALDSDPDETVDVIRSGFPLVTYGATVKAGDPLTADEHACAVPAVAGDWYLGFAEEDGEAGDTGSLWVAPGRLPAAATTPAPSA
ncbi:TPA: DUF2190 family protein [Klebsiella oxytoca]|uniref:DUF2190 family protein n=1 Tax=Klebsiella oxytoca TaxID=571 RepID=A0AAN5LBB2_KLEOX|nr:DUF2190 family protein [Klebsiella oxytoca]